MADLFRTTGSNTGRKTIKLPRLNVGSAANTALSVNPVTAGPMAAGRAVLGLLRGKQKAPAGGTQTNPVTSSLRSVSTELPAGTSYDPSGMATLKAQDATQPLGSTARSDLSPYRSQSTTSISGTPTGPTATEQYGSAAGPTAEQTPLTPEQQKEADARQYLQDESAASLKYGSKTFVDMMRGDKPGDTTGDETGDKKEEETPTDYTITGDKKTTDTTKTDTGSSVLDQLRSRVGSLAAPGSDEAALQDQLAQFRGDAQMGISGLEGQGRGIPLSLVRGQQAQLGEQASLQEQTLLDRITAASAQRQAALQAAQTELGYATQDQERQDRLAAQEQARQDSYRQEVGNSIIQYNPETGTYETLYTAPAGAAEQPATVQEYEYAKGNGYTGSFLDYQAAKAAASGSGSSGSDGFTLSPGQTRYDSSGNVIGQAAQASGAANATEGERSSAGFYSRAQAAEQTLQEMGGNTGSKWLQGKLPNQLQSSEYQQFRQAGEDFIKAVLRAESGASIPPDEMASYFKTYFPQPGDSDAVIQQKSASRQRMIDGLKVEAGRALQGSEGSQSSSTNPQVQQYQNLLQQGQITQEEYDELSQGFTSAGSTALNSSAIKSVAQNYPVGSYGAQCGRFVNRIAGLKMGNSYESKMAYVDPALGKTEPVKPGDVFVMPYDKYGHTGFVDEGKWIRQSDGSFNIPVIDSNYNLDEKVSRHYINSKKMSGFARAPVASQRVSLS